MVEVCKWYGFWQHIMRPQLFYLDERSHESDQLENMKKADAPNVLAWVTSGSGCCVIVDSAGMLRVIGI